MKKKLLISFLILMGMNFAPYAYCEEPESATKYYNEAIDLYRADDIDKSIKYFSKAIEINSNFYEAHYNLAQILMSLEKNDEAIKSLEKIYQLRPNDTDNLLTLGKVYYKKGHYLKAYDYFKKIDVNSPHYDESKIYIARIEKKQSEINLETKIKERQTIIDNQGKIKGIELDQITAPSGIAIDSRGNIYSASFSESQIYKISIYGKKTPLQKSALIKGPIGLAIDKNNNLYVANYLANNIVKISSDGNASIFADIKKPYCLMYDEEHHRLYATEQSTNKLVKFDL